MGFLGKLLKILGKITDVLIKGREAGLYDKGKGPNIPGQPSDFPPESGVKGGGGIVK